MATVDDGDALSQVEVYCQGTRAHHGACLDGWTPLPQLHPYPSGRCRLCCETMGCPVCLDSHGDPLYYEDDEDVPSPCDWTPDRLAAIFPENGRHGPVWENVRLPRGDWSDIPEPEPLELPKALARFAYDANRYGFRTDSVEPVPLDVYQRYEKRILQGRAVKRRDKILQVLYSCLPGRRVPLRRSDAWVHWRPPSPETWAAYATQRPKARHQLRAEAMLRIRQYRKHPPEPNERNFDAQEWSALYVSAFGSNGADTIAALTRELLFPYSVAPYHRLLLDAAEQGDVTLPSRDQRVWEAFAAQWDAELVAVTGPSACFIM